MSGRIICPFVEFAQATGDGIIAFTPDLVKDDRYCTPSSEDAGPRIVQCCMDCFARLLKRGIDPADLIHEFPRGDDRSLGVSLASISIPEGIVMG